jgi:hypothetical protein
MLVFKGGRRHFRFCFHAPLSFCSFAYPRLGMLFHATTDRGFRLICDRLSDSLFAGYANVRASSCSSFSVHFLMFAACCTDMERKCPSHYVLHHKPSPSAHVPSRDLPFSASLFIWLLRFPVSWAGTWRGKSFSTFDCMREVLVCGSLMQLDGEAVFEMFCVTL